MSGDIIPVLLATLLVEGIDLPGYGDDVSDTAFSGEMSYVDVTARISKKALSSSFATWKRLGVPESQFTNQLVHAVLMSHLNFGENASIIPTSSPTLERPIITFRVVDTGYALEEFIGSIEIGAKIGNVFELVVTDISEIEEHK